ncbi:MAG: hypothetical protein AAFN16_03915 [Pseudomonadota bacterium]
MKSLCCAVLLALSPSIASAAEFVLNLEGKGLREYYCTITVSLTNNSDAPLTEISGYFLSYVGEDRVGRSKGTWFMNVAPGEAQQKIFETPNAPCDDVTRYDFMIGACRLGTGFEDVSVCAERIELKSPLSAVEPSS